LDQVSRIAQEADHGIEQIPSAGVLTGDTENKLSDLVRLPRPAGRWDLRAVVLPGNQLPKSGQDRGRPRNLTALLALGGRECLAFGRQASPVVVFSSLPFQWKS